MQLLVALREREQEGHVEHQVLEVCYKVGAVGRHPVLLPEQPQPLIPQAKILQYFNKYLLQIKKPLILDGIDSQTNPNKEFTFLGQNPLPPLIEEHPVMAIPPAEIEQPCVQLKKRNSERVMASKQLYMLI